MEKMEVMNDLIRQQLGENIDVRDLLYEGYMSKATMDNDAIRESLREISECTKEMPYDQSEHIFAEAIAACVECERLAFLDGLALGAKLMIELVKE